MDIYSVLGIVLTMLTMMTLGWKWRLGMGPTGVSVGLFALLSTMIAQMIAGRVPDLVFVSGIEKSALVWLLTMGLGSGLGFGFLAFRFYRDPERKPPDREDVILSPADGDVVYVRSSEKGTLPVSTKRGRCFTLSELIKTTLPSEDAVVVGISMNFLNVHVNRAPWAGRVVFQKCFPGRFGSLRRAEMLFENERATTVIESEHYHVAVVQIASRLVRQIAVFVREGQDVGLGQRMGVIRLGSQVDLVLPVRKTLRVVVKPGDKLRAGESIVAYLDS
jgi:phosphatidylserine decarboxylase